MDLTPHIDNLRRELAGAAEVGGAEMRAAAESLTSALESSIRLMLFEVLSDAADAVTGQIEPGAVELRIRGREPELVVTRPPGPASSPGPGFSPGSAFPPGPGFPSGAAFPPGPGFPPGPFDPAWGPPAPPAPPVPPGPPEPQGDGDHGTARMTLRLPEPLKARIEQAAGQTGMSVNAWLVRALTLALSDQPPGPPPSGKRITGWAR